MQACGLPSPIVTRWHTKQRWRVHAAAAVSHCCMGQRRQLGCSCVAGCWAHPGQVHVGAAAHGAAGGALGIHGTMYAPVGGAVAATGQAVRRGGWAAPQMGEWCREGVACVTEKALCCGREWKMDRYGDEQLLPCLHQAVLDSSGMHHLRLCMDCWCWAACCNMTAAHQKQKAWPQTLTLGLQGTHSTSELRSGFGGRVHVCSGAYLHNSSKQMLHCQFSMSSSSIATQLPQSSTLVPSERCICWSRLWQSAQSQNAPTQYTRS